jgi:hypothetical protein
MKKNCITSLLSLGSMVQKGKFSAAASEVLVNTLKKVDLPTLGNPESLPILTIKLFKAQHKSPIS